MRRECAEISSRLYDRRFAWLKVVASRPKARTAIRSRSNRTGAQKAAPSGPHTMAGWHQRPAALLRSVCRAAGLVDNREMLRNAIAVAEEGRGGDVRFLGEIDTTEAATRKLITKLATKYRQLTFCYEAGPTGYGLYRLIRKLGHDCIVVAPSLIPKKPGDRVKTNRRDAVGLAKLLRAGELDRKSTRLNSSH